MTSLVIRWINGINKVQKYDLFNLAKHSSESSEIVKHFDQIPFIHIYKKFNSMDDSLSKAGLSEVLEQVKEDEYKDAVLVSSC